MNKVEIQNIYNALCRGLDHEANVMNHRIMWAILYSAGLFTASAILINLIVISKPSLPAIGLILLVMSGISGTGVFFSWTTRGGVRAAQGQFAYLRNRYKDMDPSSALSNFPDRLAIEVTTSVAISQHACFPT